MARDVDRAALFIVSPDGGQRLSALLADDGWRVTRDGGGADVAARALAAGARVVVADGRGDPRAALSDVRALGGFIAATGGALLVLLDADAEDRLDDLFAAGATHFLQMPASDGMVRHAVGFAARQAASASGQGERRGPLVAPHGNLAEAQGWIARQLDAGRHVGVLLIALSRLDILNAARGRAAGDALIAEARRQVTRIAGTMLGEAASVTPLDGGDMLVAAAADVATLARLAAQLNAALARPLPAGGRQAVLGSRWGMAESGGGDDAATLLRRAGEALIAAKASDGAMIRVAGPEGAAPLDALAVDLHLAIEQGEIDILFQPQAAISDGRIVGVEALARWHHGRLGLLGADVLFAAADRADLGLALSDHIQGLVLRRVAAWPAALTGLRVALNLTAGDLGRPGFAALFLDRVAASGVPAARLSVEITETGAIRNLEAAAEVLTTIRDAGCRVALDDFGTGYSSLAYLTALPLDYLKLDKALARGVEGTARHHGVIRAVMTLARSLDLAVIAEGVETEAQRALLADEGCAFYQGYLLAEPLAEAALVTMMETVRC